MAIGTQLDELCEYLDDLKNKRGIWTSEGVQLDGVGDIAVLDRTEAGVLACIPESVYVLKDDEYRDYLIYKFWKNTNHTTYYDVIHSFRMFWDKPLYYSEYVEIPATMIFETAPLTPDDNAIRLLRAPFVKAAGVGIRIYAITVSPEVSADIWVKGVAGRGYSESTLPEIVFDDKFETKVGLGTIFNTSMRTELSEMEDISDRIKEGTAHIWDIYVKVGDWVECEDEWEGTQARYKAVKDCRYMLKTTDINFVNFLGGDRESAAVWSYLRPDEEKVVLYSETKPESDFAVRLIEAL